MVTDTSNCTVSDTICVFVETTAIHDLPEQEWIEVFPNPANEVLHLVADQRLITQVEIFDAFGRSVRKITPPESRLQTIQVSELETGIYFLQIRMGKYLIKNKFVKY